MNATTFLIPSDGGKQAARRTHPIAGEPLGAHLPARLADLPEEVQRSVADACDANLGMAGTPPQRY